MNLLQVRNAFMKIIVFLAHFCLQDGPCPPGTAPSKTISICQPTKTLTITNNFKTFSVI